MKYEVSSAVYAIYMYAQQQQQFYLPHKLTYTQINYANR